VERKKKKESSKIAASFDPSQVAGPSDTTTSRVVEVVDPSLPQPKADDTVPAAKKSSKRDRKETEEDELFKDSRGTGPSRSPVFVEMLNADALRAQDGRGILDIQGSRAANRSGGRR
jgi:hypothetical protein